MNLKQYILQIDPTTSDFDLYLLEKTLPLKGVKVVSRRTLSYENDLMTTEYVLEYGAELHRFKVEYDSFEGSLQDFTEVEVERVWPVKVMHVEYTTEPPENSPLETFDDETITGC